MESLKELQTKTLNNTKGIYLLSALSWIISVFTLLAVSIGIYWNQLEKEREDYKDSVIAAQFSKLGADNAKLSRENTGLKSKNELLNSAREILTASLAEITGEKNAIMAENRNLGLKSEKLAEQKNILSSEKRKLENRLEEAEKEKESIIKAKESAASEAEIAKAKLKNFEPGVAIDEREIFSLEYSGMWQLMTSTFLKKDGDEIFASMDDDYYYFPSIGKFMEIINADKTEEMTYLKDKRDCDKFAKIFKGNISRFYAINGAGIAYGTVSSASEPGKYDSHAWIVFIASNESNEPALYFLEPRNDLIVEAAKTTDIGGKTYILDRITW